MRRRGSPLSPSSIPTRPPVPLSGAAAPLPTCTSWPRASAPKAPASSASRRSTRPPAARLPEDARALLARDFDRLEPAGVAGTALGLASAVNAYERLGELKVPLLVMIGDRDQDFVRSCIDFLDQLPPDLTSWITIEGAGHAANLEQPAQFETALVAFARDADYLPPVVAAPALVAAGSGGRSSTTLSVLGGALIAAGVIMVAGAFFVGRNNGNAGGFVPASNDDDPTPTAVESVSGARTPGPEFVTATPAATATTTAGPEEPTATATATVAEPTATTAQPIVIDTPVPEDTPTTAPPTPEPPTATPTPSGPYAAIAGPTSGSVGDTASFISSASPGFLRVEWSGCNPGLNPNACSLPLTQPGCVLITLVAYYPAPNGAKVANQYLAVGDGTTCP